MANELDLVSRLLAYEQGRAQRRATHLQLSMRPDALVLCPIAMAGEDTTVHAIAWGSVGEPATVWCIPDPRFRDDQFGLFERLVSVVEHYFQACLDDGTHPQVWVSSGAAVGHLDVLADRLRTNRDDAGVRRLGELLAYATERYPVVGQQALVAATTALKTHWATGQQDGEDEHLGTLLAWIDPPTGATREQVLDAVAVAELMPMGVKTDPNFDRAVLEPAVTAYNRARRDGAGTATLARLERTIEEALAPVARRIYDATQRAIILLGAGSLPPLPDLAALERREADEFASFMASRDAGYPVPLRDRAKLAAFKLAAREDAGENTEAAVVRGDRLARAAARLAGHVVVGTVGRVRAVDAGLRRTEYQVELASTQRVLHVRRRDTLGWAEDPRLRFLVEDIHRSGRGTRLSLVLTAGMRAVGVPREGSALELVTGAADWSRLWRVRSHLSKRLQNTPWTHADGGVPDSAPRVGAPTDPLAAVEALRR